MYTNSGSEHDQFDYTKSGSAYDHLGYTSSGSDYNHLRYRSTSFRISVHAAASRGTGFGTLGGMLLQRVQNALVSVKFLSPIFLYHCRDLDCKLSVVERARTPHAPTSSHSYRLLVSVKPLSDDTQRACFAQLSVRHRGPLRLYYSYLLTLTHTDTCDTPHTTDSY